MESWYTVEYSIPSAIDYCCCEVDPSWNPVMDSQAVDRAFQLSQSKDAIVYRLVTCGTVEEKIYRRKVMKEELTKIRTGDQQPSYW